MTDAEKLAKVREYVDNMFPVIRPAILRERDDALRDSGFDEASLRHQLALLRILDDS